jgi:nucleoid-associated protein YgaU
MRPASFALPSEVDVGSLARTVRFLVGASLIAAGVPLALPAGRLVASSWAASREVAPATGHVGPPVPQPAVVGSAAERPPAGPWLMPEESLPPPVMPRADYAPPPPPDRLPPVVPAVAAEAPGLNGTYRSTLQVPPPPLLDSQAMPPSAAAWTTAAPASRAVAGAAPAAIASTYVIRDGDDLASIAARFYGHPGAASSLWEANRDRIASPDLLPIGAEIRLPPPWTVQGTAASGLSGGRSIEPPPTAVTPRHVDATPVSSPWLDGRATAPVSTPAPHAATVRVAPGDTLETLAERFYGDRRAASRIWEANRDRLRSPELVVTGMELRLP